jgi:HEAT repeat protein
MIDFRFSPRPETSEAFLQRLQADVSEGKVDAFRWLSEFLLSREGLEEDLILELARWSEPDLASFLDGCWKSGVGEALALAEAVLARRGVSDMVPWMEERMHDAGACRWLVDVLANVQDDESTRLLIDLLDHPDLSIRRRAGDGLAGHRSTLDVRAFIRFLSQPLARGHERPDPLLIVRALHRIADASLEPDFGRDAAGRAERVLINCVRNERRIHVRGDAIAALGEVGSRPAVRCLVDMLGQSDREFHREVVIALRKIHPDRAFIALLGLLKSEDPIIREEAANALGEIGDSKAVRRIRDLLEDENPDVRQEAVLALGKLGGEEVLASLERALFDPDPAVRTMACAALAESVGQAAQGKLIAALYDGSADVRSEAAYHLGNVGSEDARHHLETKLRDGERDAFGDSVASVARKSLHRLTASKDA